MIGTLPETLECRASGITNAEASYAAALAAISDDAAKVNGIALGQAAAAAIIARRANDGSDAPLVNFDYPQGTQPGEWRFTPDFPLPLAFAENWANVTPFVLQRSSQFRSQPPYHVASAKYAADYDEIKLLGGDNVTTPSARTADQTEIGLFWIESSPLAWNRLAREVSVSRSLDLWQNARLFGLLNLAMADGYIATAETKYHYKFWRPITAIRLGDTDGNPATDGVLDWTPLQATYPFPDHDSGMPCRAARRRRSSSRCSARTTSRSPRAVLRSERVGHALMQHRCSAHIRASLRRLTKTRCHGFTSAFISDVPSSKVCSTDGRSLPTPSTNC